MRQVYTDQAFERKTLQEFPEPLTLKGNPTFDFTLNCFYDNKYDFSTIIETRGSG